MSRGISVEFLVLKNATVYFVLCCHDLLKATVKIWRIAGGGIRKSIPGCSSEDYNG